MSAFCAAALLLALAAPIAPALAGSLSVSWDEHPDTGCRQGFDPGRPTTFKVRMVADAGEVFVACPRQDSGELVLSHYGLGGELLDRSAILWPELTTSASPACCSGGSRFGVARHDGDTYLAFAIDGGPIRIARLRDGNWNLNDLPIEPQASVVGLDIGAGEGGVYLAWAERRCVPATQTAGTRAASQTCEPQAVKSVRLDGDPSPVLTLSRPGVASHTPSLAVTKLGAYVAFTEDCNASPDCAPYRTIAVKLVDGTEVSDRSPPKGFGPARILQPRVVPGPLGVLLTYTKRTYNVTRRPGPKGPIKVISRGPPSPRIAQLFQGVSWTASHKISPVGEFNSSSGDEALVAAAEGQTLVAYASPRLPRPALVIARHLGGDYWDSTRLSGMERMDSFAASGGRFYVGSYPRLLRGVVRPRPRLTVALDPAIARARPALRLSLTQDEDTARAFTTFSVALGLGSRRIETEVERLTKRDGTASHTRRLGRLTLVPFSGERLRASIRARRGRLYLRPIGRHYRARIRRMRLSLGEGALRLEGLPRTSLKRIVLTLRGGHSGLVRNPNSCGAILLQARLLSRRGKQIETASVARLRCPRR